MARGYALGGAALAGLLGGCLFAVALGACGARSELNVDDPQGQAGSPPDAGVDADARPDAPVDAPEDAPEDAPKECEDPDTTYIYLVSSQTELVAYKPQSNTFQSRGFLFCNADPGATPFSMAVDRIGVAHVVYNDGHLFKVSTADASCEETPFEVGQLGFVRFGMGFERNRMLIGETLYVAEISFDQPSLGLGRIDLDSYELEFIGPFSQNPGNAIELTPTGDGPLHGYFLNAPGPGGTLVGIDTATADITDTQPLPVGMGASSLAVAWWGGFYYIFTGEGAGSTVSRFDPVSQQTQVVTTTGLDIVGAGVSTCAPGAPP
jgi:hypothetical protein